MRTSPPCRRSRVSPIRRCAHRRLQGAKAAGNPWRVEVRNIRIEHFDDIWFDAFHYRGTAHLDGAFFLRPGLMVWIGPARVVIEAGEMRIGGRPSALSVAGSIEARSSRSSPEGARQRGLAESSGNVKLDARFDRLESLEHFVSSAGTRFEDGAGKATMDGSIEQGIARGEVALTAARRVGASRRSSRSAATPTCVSSFPPGIS